MCMFKAVIKQVNETNDGKKKYKLITYVLKEQTGGEKIKENCIYHLESLEFPYAIM